MTSLFLAFMLSSLLFYQPTPTPALTPSPLAIETTSFILRVSAESAYVRVLPMDDAELAGSVFQNDSLIVVGRNADGSWFQVARLGQPIGWISRAVAAFTFDPTLLPITDSTTGSLGATPVIDTGFSVQAVDDLPLYAEPDRDAALRATIPIYAILPVSERTPDNQWLLVNYRGTPGWIPQFLTYTTQAVSSFPISAAYTADPRFPAAVIVPPAVQLAQMDRLLAYLQPLNELAAGVSYYWEGVGRGEILECRALAPDVAYFSITPQDLAELPELRQQERRLHEAVDSLNRALLPTQECGILWGVDINGSFAAALNAQSIFTLVTRRMETLRARIVDEL